MDPNTPDITLAQIIGWVTALITSALILFKLDMTDAQKGALLALSTTLVTVGWFVADMIIRKARNERVAKVQSALAGGPIVLPIDGDDSTLASITPPAK